MLQSVGIPESGLHPSGPIPFPVYPSIHLHTTPDCDSLQRAKAEHPRFRVSNSFHEGINEICQKVEFLTIEITQK